MKKLQFRIILIFIAIFAIFSICIGFYSINLLQEYAVESQTEALNDQTIAAGSGLDGLAADETELGLLDEQLAVIADQTGDRVTMIDLSGEVIYDSAAQPDSLENHSDREEFRAVLSGEAVGTSARESESTHQMLFYAAVPVTDQNGDTIGVFRLSRPMAEVQQISLQIRNSLLFFILLGLVLATMITALVTKRIADPIEEIMDVAKELSEKKYDARFRGEIGYDEVSQLGETINDLAESLESQMVEITQNDERLHLLLNHLVIGVMLLDENRAIKMVNPAMSRIFDQDLTEFMGQSYVEVTKSYGLSHLIEKTYNLKSLQNNEIYFYYPEDKIVDANVVPIPGRTKGEVNLIVLLYDITEIRRLEKVRTDFVANASHELKTPVTALKGFSETLLDGAMEDKEILKQFLEIMLSESTRLDLLVSDILELSKLEQKQAPMEIKKVDVRKAVLSTFEIVKQNASLKQITLNLTEKNPVFIEGDSGRLKQILSNLINNAVIYTQKNGRVDVTISRESENAIISVSDNGMGIPEDEIDRIFERFYRVDKARSRNSGGTGLGLSIVKYLVENFNGSVSVKSTLGMGTTFTVKLPIRHI